MIIKLDSEKDSLYAVSSANWEMVVKAPTRNDSCVLALTAILEKYGSNTQLSPTIACINITDTFTEITTTATYTFLPTKAVLILAGFEDLASSFEGLVDFYEENDS